MDGEKHLRDWATLHLTEPPSGFVGGWLRATAAVARPLARAGISPNAVTVAAVVMAVAAVPLAAIDGWTGPAAACAAVVLSGILDALDGAVAVQAGRTTKVGFLLDSALDRLADAALPAALAVAANGGTGGIAANGTGGIAANGGTGGIAAGEAVWVAVGAVAACWWLEYVRARASLAAAGQPFKQVITPGERPTRIILTAVGLGLPALALPALWAHVVIVGGSGVFLFVDSVRRLRHLDRGDPPAPTAAS